MKQQHKQNPAHGHYQEIFFFSANSPVNIHKGFFMAIFKYHCSLTTPLPRF